MASPHGMRRRPGRPPRRRAGPDHPRVGVLGTAAALAVQDLARTRWRTLLVTVATTSELTGAACARIATHWAEDTAAHTPCCSAAPGTN
ncbi:MAG: hypothetical protein P4L71_16140 [Acetobacteraceae bacterium]|nr:hypothetical protein [Acetobacteraceae bacterium]